MLTKEEDDLLSYIRFVYKCKDTQGEDCIPVLFLENFPDKCPSFTFMSPISINI